MNWRQVGGGQAEGRRTGRVSAWGEQTATRMLHVAGFGRVRVCAVDGDCVNSYYLAGIAPGMG